MSINLDHERAKFASQRLLSERFSGCARSADLKNYRTAVLGAGVEVRQRGILQVCAFWASKGDKDRLLLMCDVLSWLLRCDRTAALLPGFPDPTDAVSSVNSLAGLPSRDLALLDDEACEILDWYKRLTEAKYKALERAEGPTKQDAQA